MTYSPIRRKDVELGPVITLRSPCLHLLLREGVVGDLRTMGYVEICERTEGAELDVEAWTARLNNDVLERLRRLAEQWMYENGVRARRKRAVS